jgi:GTP-binding protein
MTTKTSRGARPIVAIVGRPNVGKSTLFNRIAGNRAAVVSEVPGTTRDRVTTETVWGDREFILVDTGGLDPDPQGELLEDVRSQVDVAVSEADTIVFLVDANEGLTSVDRDVADLLRRSGKRPVLAANKADNRRRAMGALDFHELGLGDPIPISAHHNLGVDDLMTEVLAHLPPEAPETVTDAGLKLAIVGRTNVGKSALLNAVTGEERAIVSDVPGTTRDTLDALVSYGDETVLIVDTAGIRRRGRIKPGIERYSALRAVRSIDRAEVAILVMDASEVATGQDTHIASYVLDAYKGIVLCVNKWDLARGLGLDKRSVERTVRERFKFAAHAPVIFVSALRRYGMGALLEATQGVRREWSRDVQKSGLKRTVLTAMAAHPPATAGRHAVKVYGVSQDQTGPPSFTFYVNRADMVHFSYQRYLENTLRRAYGFQGTPLRVRFKGGRGK